MSERMSGLGVAMDEGRRRAYLAALGVDHYVARQPLPHAAASWLPEWEAEARWEDDPTLAPVDDHHDLASAMQSASTGGAATSVAEATRQLVEQSTLVKGVPPVMPLPSRAALSGDELPIPVLRNLKPEPAAPRPTATKPVSLRVGISVVEWPEKMRVLIEMQDPDAPSLASLEHRLWQEIALALWGRDQAYCAQSLPMLRFPPHARLRHLETPEAVRDAVESFLHARNSRNSVPLQVLFAGQGLAAAYLGLGGVVLQPYLVAGSGGAQTLLLPGLAQMLEDWRLKPAVWQALATAFQHAGLS